MCSLIYSVLSACCLATYYTHQRTAYSFSTSQLSHCAQCVRVFFTDGLAARTLLLNIACSWGIPWSFMCTGLKGSSSSLATSFRPWYATVLMKFTRIASHRLLM